MSLPSDLILNDQFKSALRMMEGESRHLFITGKAGTGKSTLLKYFRDHTQKQFAVLAPTGVAAVNIEGQTIHSFFKFRPDVTPDRVRKKKSSPSKKKTIYQKLQVIIIDEISMVRADLMDCIDKFLRFNGPVPGEPFGGVQVILFGDLFQLPPVVRQQDWEALKDRYQSPHFFSAQVMADLDLYMIELDHIYRQKDPDFIDILNHIRSGRISDEMLQVLNQRCCGQEEEMDLTHLPITLTGTNKVADDLNHDNLETIDAHYHLLEGEITGEFRQDSLPSPQDLKLKPGAQVMMTNNDQKQRWINGTMGRVLRVGQNDDYEMTIRVELETGKRVTVSQNTWDMTKYTVVGDKIVTEVVGSYKQFPLKLAWAITVHKSQGKTFDQVIIDLGRSAFAAGQTYVALSRCRTLEGIRLKQTITQRHMVFDAAVVRFLVSLQIKQAQDVLPDHEKLYRIAEAIDNSHELEIDYIRLSGETSKRRIDPESLGERLVQGRKVDVLKAYCYEAQKDMIFSIQQIMSLISYPKGQAHP